MNEHGCPRVVVVALGNPWRRDDGVGYAVLERLRHLGLAASMAAVREPIELLDLWSGADLAVVIDALRVTDHHPGEVQVTALQLESDSRAASAPGACRPGVSSHGVGVVEVLRLAQQLGTAPLRVVVVGVVGGDFGNGVGLTAAATGALGDAARLVAQAVRSAVAEAAPAEASLHT